MRRILLIALNISLVTCASFAQNTEYWGMTMYGGNSGVGTIYNTNDSGTNFNIQHSFNLNDGNSRYTKLCKASNGKLYGLTSAGGEFGYGVVYEYNPNSSSYTIKASFNNNNGSKPTGSLIQATNGKFYGMTPFGGNSDDGVIFEFDINTNSITKLLDFDGYNNGSYPNGSLLEATNGKFYGLTAEGGVNDLGVIFEYDIATNTYTKKLDFDGANNGEWPFGSLIQASNNKLYGIANEGGVNDLGVLFEYDLATESYSKKLDFNDANGKWPIGSIIQASNGNLFGLTYLGGSNGLGLLYEYNYNTNTFTKKFDFDGQNGSYPIRDLTEASNGKLYGLTSSGGLTNGGVLFEFDISTNNYSKKLDFNSYNGTPNYTGSFPQGSLIESSNGILYGLTQSGGAKNAGVLFEYNIVAEIYDKKYDFGGSENGHKPKSGLLETFNGMLYGVTSSGGANDFGTLFKYNPQTKEFIKLIDFEGSSNGRNPVGKLFQSSDSTIYGLTQFGGQFDGGIVFRLDTKTDSFEKLIDLNQTIGKEPFGGIVEHFTGKLYFTTSKGGVNSNFGTIIVFTPKNISPFVDTFISLANFDNNSGYYPSSGLSITNSNEIYGTTYLGGNFGNGTIYKFFPFTNVIVKKHDFQYANGISPIGELTQAENNKLYGLTYSGGSSNKGVLYEYDLATEVYTKRHDFGGFQDGVNPQSELMSASNGNLYGYTTNGGIDNAGVIFEYDPTQDFYSKKTDLTLTDGQIPLYGSLVETNICYYSFDTISLSGENQVVSPSGNETWTSSGLYTDTLINDCGSDSILFVNLSMCNYVYSNIDITTQNTYISPSGNFIWTETGIYQDTLFNANTCGGDSILTIDLTIEKNTDITENNFEALSYYPNPTNNILNVELGENFKNISISLKNIQGKELLSRNFLDVQNISLDCYVPKGIYFVEIKSDTKHHTIKIIKE